MLLYPTDFCSCIGSILNTDWHWIRRGCWGEHLDPRGRKWQKDGEETA